MAGYESSLNKLKNSGMPTPKASSFSAIKAPTVRKMSIQPAQSNLRQSQKVGLLGSAGSVGGVPAPPTMKTAAGKIVTIRPHLRKQKDGKLVRVVGHTRKEDDEEAKKPAPQKPAAKKEEKPKFDSVKDEVLGAKQAKDKLLWNTWNDGGRKAKDLRPLLKRFRGMIESRARVYKGKGVPIPDAAIDAEFRSKFVESLTKYDPEKGSLGTFVYRNLDAAKRFIATHQNLTRIPETRIYRIGEFNSARSYLSDLYGRDPNESEMSEFMGWSLKEVTRLSKEMRQDLVTSGFESDPSATQPSREREVLNLLKYELSPDERKVYAFLVGTDGKKEEQSTGVIAKDTGMSIYKVSRIRKSIAEKAKRYMR